MVEKNWVKRYSSQFNILNCVTKFVNKYVFFQEMKRTGIRAKSDPRMRPVVAAMEKFKPKPNASLESLNLVLFYFFTFKFSYEDLFVFNLSQNK